MGIHLPPPDGSLREQALERRAEGVERRVPTRVRIDPVVEIVRGAEEWHAELVLGTHGRGGFRRLWLESTAAAAARGAGCSVLVISGTPVEEPLEPLRVVAEPADMAAALSP